jgi:uncharacterized repeat protein (TIGR01451 family)
MTASPLQHDGKADVRFSWRQILVVASLTLLCGAQSAAANVDKAASYQEMLALTQQLVVLKPQTAASPTAALEYEAAANRYLELSLAMGGDDPGQILQAVVPSVVGPTTPRPNVLPLGCNTTTTNFTNAAVASPTGPGVVTSPIVVSGASPYLLDLNLATQIQHTFSADLDVTLTSPAGTVVTLTSDNGAGNDDVFNGTVWDDSANPAGQVPYTTNTGLVTDHAYVNLSVASPLVPEEAMAAFIGEDPNGTWTLTISDDLAGDGGNLASWSLDIDTFTCASADLSITKTDGVTNPAAGQSVTYTISASNAGPTDAAASTVADTFPAPLAACAWTCAGAAGGTCSAAGAGNISDAVNLPSGGSVTYTATCSIPASTAAGTMIANTATVTAPVGIPDPVPGNNSATDTDTTVVSADLSIIKTDGVTSVVAGDADL